MNITSPMGQIATLTGFYCIRSMLKQFQTDTEREQLYKKDGNTPTVSHST